MLQTYNGEGEKSKERLLYSQENNVASHVKGLCRDIELDENYFQFKFWYRFTKVECYHVIEFATV